MLNVSAIMGRLTADPELRHTQNNIAVTAFTVAVDRSYVKQGEDRQADFIDVVAWRSTAEFICKYFTKGKLIAISGAIQTRSYEDKNGNKRKATEIVANDVSFGGDKAKDDQRQSEYGSAYGDPPPERRSYGYSSGQTGNSPAYPPSESAPSYSGSGNEDYEEIMGDDDLPF